MIKRNTLQKTRIKEYLASRTDHPTAEMVYSDLKPEMPKLSLGTVYRNLNSLAENGEILKFKLQDGIVHYDGITENHYHFICNECGSVSDVFNIKHKLSFDKESFDGEYQGHLTYFYGRCKNCIGNNQ